jgi:hypothetical protein
MENLYFLQSMWSKMLAVKTLRRHYDIKTGFFDVQFNEFYLEKSKCVEQKIYFDASGSSL